MGLRCHRLLNVRPLHVTSKSGISYGAGVKGARITGRADGGIQATVSAPGYLPWLHNTRHERESAQVRHPGTAFPALAGSRYTEGSTR